MTARSILICDVCGKPPRGALTEFRAAMRGQTFTWDVGDCCMDTRFKPRQHRAISIVVTVNELEHTL